MAKKNVEKEEQTQLRSKIGGWAKGFSTLCLVLRIFLYLGIVSLALVLLALPTAFKAIKIEDNQIKIMDKVIEYNVSDDSIASITIDGKEYNLNGKDLFKISKDTLTNENLNNLKKALIVVILTGIVVMILTVISLKKIGNLLKSMKNEEKVFVKDGHKNLLSVMKLEIAILVVIFVGSIITSIIVGTDSSISINIGVLVTILGVYFLSLIYKYGENLEDKE